MKEEVVKAIQELRINFPESEITVKEDPEGGALVVMENVIIDLSTSKYNQDRTWIGFRINFQYPYADVYPIFVREDLSRKDGSPLGPSMSKCNWENRPAIQVSRRSNKRVADFDTASLKIQKVLQWLITTT